MKFKDGRSWHYQLQGDVASDIDADIVVIDIDTDPTHLLRSDRCVLAYLSIGEAEDYRDYWSLIHERRASWPLLLGENPDWPGNWAVRFWDQGWTFLMETRADEARRKGFNGLYLDKLDVTEDMEVRWPNIAKAKDLKLAMIGLIGRIGAAAPELEIIAQNGTHLLDSPGFQPLVDGLAIEDWLFGDPDTGVQNAPPQTFRMRNKVRDSGLPTVAVEYINDNNDIRYAARYFKSLNIPFFVADESRELDGR